MTLKCAAHKRHVHIQPVLVVMDKVVEEGRCDGCKQKHQEDGPESSTNEKTKPNSHPFIYVVDISF